MSFPGLISFYVPTVQYTLPIGRFEEDMATKVAKSYKPFLRFFLLTITLANNNRLDAILPLKCLVLTVRSNLNQKGLGKESERWTTTTS